MNKNMIDDKEFELRQKRILEISDKILDKVDSALTEIDRCIIKTKEKVKTVEYDGELKKPISEQVCESEKAEIIESMIDTASLKQIVATLKDVKDIHLGFLNSDSDTLDDGPSGIIMISDVNKDDCEDKAV